MKTELETAAVVLDRDGLKEQANFLRQLAAGKQNVFVVMRATPEGGYLQWTFEPSDEDFTRAEDYPDLYFDRATAQQIAEQATIDFVRKTPLRSYWEGMRAEASNRDLTVEDLTKKISSILDVEFTGGEELLCSSDTTDAALREIIELTGYHYFRVEAITLFV